LDVSSIAKRRPEGKKILEFVISAKLTDAEFLQAIPHVLSLSKTHQGKIVISEPFAFIYLRNNQYAFVGRE
jgi:hypothetical protein